VPKPSGFGKRRDDSVPEAFATFSGESVVEGFGTFGEVDIAISWRRE
jgi:hypothetical protein